MSATEYNHANIAALDVAPEPCSRCGRVNCDEMPAGYLDRLAALLERAPEVTEDYEGEEVEPLL